MVAAPPITPKLPWAGLYDTSQEADQPDVVVEGTVPAGLTGTLYRVGPGRLEVAQHLFDGDGMVAAVRFGDGGKVSFRNRFVRTKKYELETGSARPKVAGYGTLAAGGPLRNALRPPTAKNSAANTNVMFSAGRLLALWEAGHPWQLDPVTLETAGQTDFDGVLPKRVPFSAHPHWDPETGDIFNFGMVYGPKTSIACFRLDRSGKLRRLAQTRIPAPVMNHDFIITKRFLVFCLGPVRVRIGRLLAGVSAFGDAIRWHDDEPTRVVLVPRDGSPAMTIEAPAWFQFHFAAAFDDGDDVVVDLARWPDYDELARNLKNFRTADFAIKPATLWRYRISTRSRTVESHQLSSQGLEFPQVDGRRAIGGYRYVYGSLINEGRGLMTALGRIDTVSGKVDQWDFGAGHVVTEPLFVPAPGSTTEDGGWLVALVYDPDRRASDAVVLDAAHPETGPLCTAHLPVNTGMSFHGTWRAVA